MAPNPATSHQTFQPMPKLDAPLTNANGNVSIPWYYFLVTLWQRTGGSSGQPVSGNIIYDNSTGGAEIVQTLAASPFVFLAAGVGFLTAAGGKIELNRSGVWYEVSVTGGSFWLMAGDQARVTWFGDAPPQVIWWPTQ